MLVIVAKCPRKQSEDFMILSNDFHAFHRFADLQSEAFFWKLTVEQYLKTEVSPWKPLFLHSLQYDPGEVKVLTNIILLVLG